MKLLHWTLLGEANSFTGGKSEHPYWMLFDNFIVLADPNWKTVTREFIFLDTTGSKVNLISHNIVMLSVLLTYLLLILHL